MRNTASPSPDLPLTWRTPTRTTAQPLGATPGSRS
jgi:hypothetical protein